MPHSPITTPRTPPIVTITRLAFFIYALVSIGGIFLNKFSYTEYSLGWFGYLVLLYFVGEQLYTTFNQRGIDLSFAFPLLFAIYMVNFASMLLDAQEKFPLLNRVEHFASFVLITYVVWVFFLQYLPHNVWHDHPYYTALLVFSVVAAFGVVNEIVELILDQLFQSRLIGTSRLDTSFDLLMNTLGSSAFLAVELLMGQTEKKQSSS